MVSWTIGGGMASIGSGTIRYRLSWIVSSNVSGSNLSFPLFGAGEAEWKDVCSSPKIKKKL
jgi:hypothetical protein